ncbi:MULTISPECIES: GFA family protein [unclassified Ruegeria]|uniref:GFA family protein n=1 Tax=unclassified Ruegeria TaxID=2625375 RepID=UPI001489AF44|nr:MULTISPECIES: GFA family protein [unclassified Ruegeria]
MERQQNTDVSAGPATGGCQCGAVRYSIGRLGKASICHCRMCQKAFGSFFAPLVEAYDVSWTRGERSIFHSSTTNWRGFCDKCGTPLTYEFNGGLEIAIGTFDDPDRASPVVQVNAKYKRHCFDSLADLPEKPPDQQEADEVWNESVRSNQHPDHDT